MTACLPTSTGRARCSTSAAGTSREQAISGMLAPLLEITTTLDPHLVVAYQFGANFLAPKPPNGAGMPEKAIQLVNYGIQNNPNDWKLYYELGFIYYMDLKDYAKAADAFARGSQVPDAHPFLKVMAAQMAQHAGDTQMARALWTTTYQSTQDKQIRGNALAHLRALQVADEVTAIEALVGQYRQTTGRTPASLDELVAANYLKYVPLDPAGHPYRSGRRRPGRSRMFRTRFLSLKKARRPDISRLGPRIWKNWALNNAAYCSIGSPRA